MECPEQADLWMRSSVHLTFLRLKVRLYGQSGPFIYQYCCHLMQLRECSGIFSDTILQTFLEVCCAWERGSNFDRSVEEVKGMCCFGAVTAMFYVKMFSSVVPIRGDYLWKYILILNNNFPVNIQPFVPPCPSQTSWGPCLLISS